MTLTAAELNQVISSAHKAQQIGYYHVHCMRVCSKTSQATVYSVHTPYQQPMCTQCVMCCGDLSDLVSK